MQAKPNAQSYLSEKMESKTVTVLLSVLCLFRQSAWPRRTFELYFFGPLVVWWQLTQWGRKHWNTQRHAEPRVPAQTFSKPRRCPSPCLIGDVWEGRQCRGTMIALWPSEEVGWDWVGVNTQQDQIKMWQRAKMAAKVFQSQSCDLASPITRQSPVFATVRWHWLMQLMPGWK